MEGRLSSSDIMSTMQRQLLFSFIGEDAFNETKRGRMVRNANASMQPNITT